MATAAQVRDALALYRFVFSNEKDLQAGIAEALLDAELLFQREARLTDQDVVDFLVSGGVALEVKIAGTWTAVFAQLQRYALSTRVKEVLLVTRRARHDREMPPTVGGKPLFVLTLGDTAL